MSTSSSSRALLFFRRTYSTVAAENVDVRLWRAAAATSVTRKVVETAKKNVECGVGKDVFWMKDPKTGNWLPETHFDEVDAVELREKFLSTKAKAKAAAKS